MSKINCVSPAAYASMDPLLVGKIAMFDVIHPSGAFSVDTAGWFYPSGHSVRYANVGDGITMAFATYPCAAVGTWHGLLGKFTGGLSKPLNGCPLPTPRESNTRQGVSGYKDSPP